MNATGKLSLTLKRIRNYSLLYARKQLKFCVETKVRPLGKLRHLKAEVFKENWEKMHTCIYTEKARVHNIQRKTKAFMSDI